MKYTIWFTVLLMILTACGRDCMKVITVQSQAGVNGTNGTNGSNGSNGSNGTNGHSVVFDTLAATPSQCSNGGTVITMATDTNDDGIVEATDANIKVSVICNGQNGATGATGTTGSTGASAPTTPFTPVTYVTPCGPNSSPYKEILLVLEDGSILADFSDNVNGYNTRLAFIPDGSYIDTDSSACAFTISTSETTRTASWAGGSQSWTIN